MFPAIPFCLVLSHADREHVYSVRSNVSKDWDTLMTNNIISFRLLFIFLGGTVSMTDASGKPYVGAGGAGNGSMASVATSGSVASTASPLRSSLKKPKPLGIHNPGFSAHSPTLSRNGSQKKVRIQTHSTEVWLTNDDTYVARTNKILYYYILFIKKNCYVVFRFFLFFFLFFLCYLTNTRFRLL